MIFGIFGPIFFSRALLMSEFEAKHSENFAEHNLHLRTPAIEAVGPGLTEVTFSMTFFEGVTTAPTAGLLLLETLLKGRKAFPLIIGTRPIGTFQSKFVLTELGASHHWYTRFGTVQHATVKVSLKEYASLATAMALGL